MKMNLRFYIICIAAVLALVIPVVADSNNTATIRGEVYGWDTFEPLKNAVVEVNSTPSQSMVAKYSVYSFTLVPGNYSITARYYQNGTLLYSGEETVEIKDNGDYVKDLLLLPVYSEALMDGSEVNGSSTNTNKGIRNSSNEESPAKEASIDQAINSSSENNAEENENDSPTLSYLMIALASFILLTAGYQLSRKHKKTDKNTKNILQEAKTGYTHSSLSAPDDVSESSKKVPSKSTEPETKQAFQANPEKTISIKRSEPESESRVTVTEQIAESESEIAVKALVGEPEPDTSLKKVLAAETESETREKKVPAGRKEEYLAQEEGLAVSEQEEEPGSEGDNGAVFLKESEDNPEIKTPSKETEVPAAPRKRFPLPADLQEVMDIIRGQGGRITQKDLRSKLKYSEGKVSLMLADLERRELIEKFKRGRGNIIIVKDEER